MFKRRGGGLLRRWLWEIDIAALMLVLIMMAVGVILITTASTAIAERMHLPMFYFVHKQLVFLSIAIVIIVSVSMLPERSLRKLCVCGFLCAIILMALVLFCGEEIKGARRWFNIFGLSIQPSEFLKPFMCVILGFVLSEFNTKIVGGHKSNHESELILGSLHKKRSKTFVLIRYINTFSNLFKRLINKNITPITDLLGVKQEIAYETKNRKTNNIARYFGINADFFELCIVITIYMLAIVPLIMQPDFGMSASITLITLGQFFIAGLSVLFIISALILCMLGIILAYYTLPHVAHRINSFLRPETSDNYQVSKSLDAYLNGGLFGRGPGEGSVKAILPDCHTDFIFAIVGEEFGGIASIMIMSIFLIFVVRCLNKLKFSNNLFHIYTCSGLLMHMMFQTFFNIGVTLHLLPTKGMTLPFISYGGSSTLSFAFIIGIYLNFTRKKYGVEKPVHNQMILLHELQSR